MKLFCLHCAGGSSNLFKKWNFKDVEIIPIDLPGRGKNMNLPMINSFSEAKMFVENEIIDKTVNNQEWAILGHSMGAYIAYEIVKDAIDKPFLQILSGIDFFHETKEISILEENDLDLIRNLEKLGGIAKGMSNKEYFVEWFSPLIRSDLGVVNTFFHNEVVKLIDTPTIIINSKDDVLVGKEDSKKWSQYFKVLKYILIQGDHFSIYENDALIHRLLEEYYNFSKEKKYCKHQL